MKNLFLSIENISLKINERRIVLLIRYLALIIFDPGIIKIDNRITTGYNVYEKVINTTWI